MKLRNLFFTTFGLFIIVLSFLSIGEIVFKGRLQDLGYFLRAVGTLLTNNNIYLTGDFNYLPVVVLLFIPIYCLPIILGQLIYSVFSLVAVVISVALLFRMNKWKIRISNLLLVLGLVLLSFPTRFTLGMGQVNNFVLLFLTTSIFFFEQNYLAGFFLGIASLIKINPILLSIYLTIKNKLSILLFMYGVFIGGVVISVVMVGPGGLKKYFFQLVGNTGLMGKSVYYNQAMSGFLSRLFGEYTWVWFFWLLLGLIVAVITILTTRQTGSALAGYSLYIPMIILISPYSWQHHLVLLAIPMVFLAGKLIRKKGKKAWFLLLLVYVLISWNIKNPNLLGNSYFGKIWLSHACWGCLILWAWIIKISCSDEN